MVPLPVTCPACGTGLLIVTNEPGSYLCPVCRATVRNLDVKAWQAELTELRDQQRAAIIETMRMWRRDADHLAT
jgi:uncharacterized Zn finger protein (UPF0148 family)